MDVQIRSDCGRWTSQSVLDMWTLSRRLRPRPERFTRQFTEYAPARHITAHRQSDVNIFFHLRRLHKLSHILDFDTRKRLVCALILTRLDYCNSALAGLSDSALAPLQRVLHAAAQFVLDLQPRDHVTVALQTLHRLPVRQRVTLQAVHTDAFGYAPTYLLDAVVPVSMLPGRTHLRSADSGLYDVPRVSSSVGSRAFSVAGPQAWNHLPTCTSICQMDCIATFKRHLTTSLFMEA